MTTTEAHIRKVISAAIVRHMATEPNALDAAAAAAQELDEQAINLGWDVDTRAALARTVAEVFADATAHAIEKVAA